MQLKGYIRLIGTFQYYFTCNASPRLKYNIPEIANSLIRG